MRTMLVSLTLLGALGACSSPPASSADLAQAGLPDQSVARDLAVVDAAMAAPDLAMATIGATIVMKDDFYMPNMVTINAGQKVKWTWQAAGAHGVDSSDNAFPDGPIFMQGGASTYEHTFTQPGTYPVRCLVHGTAMPMTIVVK